MRKLEFRAGLWGMAVCSATLILEACVGSDRPATTYTPPTAVISGDPWQAAEKLAAKVPNSMLFVGHGEGMLPFYPEGTVLVMQRLKWEHLREGMTVIYYREPGNRFSITGNILVENHGDYWLTVSAKGGDFDSIRVDATNYNGTVVAAFRNVNPTDPGTLLRSIPSAEAATCLMRCHIR
jgi:hypothetical protein